ncbi:hypothetical protein J2H33_000224 [Salmonella enterica]|nr:hypothetical protein [Salmonella enterica]
MVIVSVLPSYGLHITSFIVISSLGCYSGHFFVYNTPFLNVASGEVFNAGQSFDAGDRKGPPK